MKLTYNLETKDYVDFNLYHIQYTDKIKNKLKIQRITGAVLFVSVGVVMAYFANKYQVILLAVMTLLGVFWFLNFPKLAISRVRKSTEKALSKAQLTNLFDELTLIFSDKGILEKNLQGEHLIRWDEVQSVVYSLEYIYFLLKDETAMIVPKRTFELGQMNELKSIIDTNFWGVKTNIDTAFN